MAYLYINFLDNLEQGLGSKAWGGEEFYTASLQAQYESIKPKLGYLAMDTLQQFVGMVFPAEMFRTYYISMPGFNREMKVRIRKDGTPGNKYINNVVIRPEHDQSLDYALPPQYDIILIGDVTFGSVIDFSVKGLELIDRNTAKFGEKAVRCIAACAFTNKSFVANGRAVTVPDYGTREMRDPVLTNDFVLSLCNECYPVPHPEKAIRVFNDWKRYVEFRKYYLGKLSERCEEISSVRVCNAYMITKEAYRRNEESYESLLLDGVDAFKKGEQVVLSQSVAGAEEFPLICVSVERLRIDLLKDVLGKSGKGKPKFEAHLQRYTKHTMGLSSQMPKYDEKGNLRGLRSYLLGERYLFSFVDVEPDCTVLEKEYQKGLDKALKEIDSRYAGIILNALNKFMEQQTALLQAQYAQKLKAYAESLTSSLETDIQENKDKEVIREYEAEIAKQTAPFEAQRKKKHDEIRVKMKKLKDKKLSDEEYDEEYDILRASAETVDIEYYREVDRIKESISIRDFYVARNNRLIENKQKSLSIQMQADLETIKKDKKAQLELQYRQTINDEKAECKKELENKFNSAKADKIEKETIRRYQIYFRPEDITEKITKIQKDIESFEPKYLTYDNRAEKAKIDRQEKALASLMAGYVKNPFLPVYLFAPESLSQATRELVQDPDWCLESLNDRQKLAVKRALASESIFLLQGPPGTGKTQVIAEITAQLTKRGKKVLISSETHKAIDNVFERLPKIPEIRPLRLIPSQNGKETNYSPAKLVDNFYMNISGSLEREVSRFEHFEETKATFDEQMKTLRFEYNKVLRLQKENVKVDRERTALIEKINRFNNELESLRLEQGLVRETIDEYRRTIKYIESYQFKTEGAKENYIELFRRQVQALLMEFACFESVPVERIAELVRLDANEVREELQAVLSDDTVVALKARQQELRRILQSLRDPDTDDAPEEGTPNYLDYKKYQTELKEIVSAIKRAESETSFDFSASKIFEILPEITNDKELLKRLPDELTALKIKLQSLVLEIKNKIEDEVALQNTKESEIAEKISDKQLEISECKRVHEELGGNSGVAEYVELNSALKQKITRFFRDFNIIQEYDSDNLETAFTIIDEEWRKMEYDYKATQSENKTKIPMYKEIVKYLSQEDILEEDRQAYTRELYNNVNVFGITCTSRDRFTSNQLIELERYGIKDVNIRTQGIDVVIVDEVSKSSFLDLLIPILYGKTVILVGDHRQLPPMYDLRHMREEDFEGLDPYIIGKEINEYYTNLYEECFFKTLYERVPEEFRVMLNKQYRCHSHIMEVFNHFYGGSRTGLMVGKKHQDDEKQHGLTVKINGNTVLDREHHIYFIDCDERESSAYEGSTSKINEQEAQVAMTLLKALDQASGDLLKNGKIKVSKEKKIDERPSVGVICTYGDQAGLIKKKIKYAQFANFSAKQDERLIISTVDDFQGDERDIIIVSMVRNPAHYDRANADFIKKFERINVALSRARKMLIIVGSKKFLSEKGIIDLPDMTGNKALDKLNFPVYKEIIDTIAMRGRLIPARDIIGD